MFTDEVSDMSWGNPSHLCEWSLCAPHKNSIGKTKVTVNGFEPRILNHPISVWQCDSVWLLTNILVDFFYRQFTVPVAISQLTELLKRVSSTLTLTLLSHSCFLRQFAFCRLFELIICDSVYTWSQDVFPAASTSLVWNCYMQLLFPPTMLLYVDWKRVAFTLRWGHNASLTTSGGGLADLIQRFQLIT